jgi:hypothetical protein
MIKHAPIFDTERVEKLYSKKDGVDITYVCSTDLDASDVPMDIFYRDTPHPEFGNKYFGLFRNPDPASDGHLMITNADKVEDFEFGMIQDKDGNYWYSQSHHDCLFVDGKMIDGGRRYIRHSGEAELWKVKNGKMVRTVYSKENEVT